MPCDNDSNCCTRKCVDLGSGTKVCQPAGGCRMTGNYCDSDDACCNINHLVADSQDIHCEPDDHTCDHGGSCNPPGNICGDIASQNCCYGKKDVCKSDMNGVLRCFGGPPTSCDGGGCSGTCPTGWDGNDPMCCIPSEPGPDGNGNICQFRDQCCGYAPCVPDAQGVLRCADTNACKPQGTRCIDAGDTSCCEGTSCTNVTEIGWICALPTDPGSQCVPDGGGCSATTDPCCAGPGACITDTTGAGTCNTCVPNGNACTVDGQCCGGSCDQGVCRAPCQGETSSCTVDGDCCFGLSCHIEPGATSGQCTSAGGSCADTGQTCVADGDCCNAPGEGCVEGVCAVPPPLCPGIAMPCSATTPCCEGLSCNTTIGACEAPTCGNTGQSCTTAAGCCATDDVCALASNTAQPCTDGASCVCVKPAVCAPLNQPCAPTPGCCNGVCVNQAKTSEVCNPTTGMNCICVIIG
ncbi:MAG TPA: hypothetical protein VLC54_16815 [Anaeromyxobacter sp.]|nr:hypothetical protein [Anaeromyxobacter sp.]